MASPFNVFRRNQRVMMVVLTGLAMVSFLFLDPTLMRGGIPPWMIVAMFAALCAAGLWFVGRRHGKSNEWALWGAVLGGVAALFFVRSGGQEAPVIRTKVANFSENTLRDMGQKRYQVNQFAYRASQVNKNRAPSQGFGPADDRSMIQFALGKEEAKRLGISLNDEAVNRYITDITDDKLSQKAFSEILKDLNLSAGDLFNLLRTELEVRLAMEVQAPPYDTWMDIDLRSGQSYFRPKLPATPEEQWQQFLKLEQKESLSVVAFPVDAFLSKVPEPSETDLKGFFDARKELPPGPQGQAGFVQPHRVRVAYLAADFVKFESQATVPTEEEIAAYYEDNKVKYQIRDIPDSAAEDEDAPADAANPVNVAPALPPLDETPVDQPESKSEPDAQPESKPETDEKSDKPKDGDSSSAALERGAGFVRLVSATSVEDAKSEETKTEEPKAEESKTEEPKTEPADAAKEESTDAKQPAGDGEFPLIRYRPLDDDLKDRIREEILRDRAFEKMGDAVELARIEMERHASTYLEAEEADKAKFAGEIAEKLKTYAVDHSLEYVETPLMSQLEMQTSSSESIGTAALPTPDGAQFRSVMVVDELFPRTGQVGPSYFAQRADSRLREKRYAWWKIEDKPQHAPEWSDEGIQDQVLAAWKYEKARQTAQKRVEDLKDALKTSTEDFAAALAGQTVTGEPGTRSAVIVETPRFSWLTTSMSTPFDPEMGDFLAPRRSFVNGVDQPGDDFMKTVFEDLNVGEIGVAANIPRNTFYLVKVRDRDGTATSEDVEEFQSLDDLRTKFASSLATDQGGFATRPYNLMMFNTFGRVQQEWGKAFDERYGVKPDDMSDMPTASRRKPRR